MKDLPLKAGVVVKTSNMKISRRRLVDYVKSSYQKACRTCSTIIFPHSTNQINDLWRCRRSCGRHFLNSLLFQSFGTRWVLDANMTLSRTTKSDSGVEKTNGTFTTASISSLQSYAAAVTIVSQNHVCKIRMPRSYRLFSLIFSAKV